MTTEDKRLGRNGYQEIQNHVWFKNFNWRNLSNVKVPFIPELRSDDDVCNFDNYDEEDPWEIECLQPVKKDPNFIGYTYKQ